MSEIQNTILGLEEHLEQSKTMVERRDALLRLSENRDYKKLIREEFMRDDCARFAQQSVNPVLKPEERADALAKAQAAGHLKQYLSVIILQGNTAEATIPQINEAIEEARAMPDEDEDE